MDKQAILDAFDKMFGRRMGYSFEGYRNGLEKILTAQEGESDLDYLSKKIEDYVVSGRVTTAEALTALADFSNWLDQQDGE